MGERIESALSIIGAIVLILMLPLLYPVCMVLEWRARRICARIGHEADGYWREQAKIREVYCPRCRQHYTTRTT